MALLSFLFPEKKKSANAAKERLQIIIARERTNRTGPDFLPALHRELIEVISKYTKVNADDIKLSLDRQGNLYVADTLNHTIRRIDRANNVTTIAGVAGSCGSSDGRGNAARFCEPQDIEVDEDGYLYVADTVNSTIRGISPKGEVRTLAGVAGQCGSADGTLAAARFCRAAGLTIDGAGNLFVADTGNGTIRRIDTRGTVTTVIGVAGSQNNVLGPLPGGLNAPRGIAVTGAGTLAATSQNLVLKLVPR